MKYILREGFDFNNVISNNDLDINKSNTVTDIIINNINENEIKNIINKILSTKSNLIDLNNININIKTLDNSIFIKIQYERDKTKYVIIELRYINNIIYTYIKYFSNTWLPVSKCTIQILNYLKSIHLNISNVIRFNTASSDKIIQNKKTKLFYLQPNGVRHILLFIENNYKIKLVDDSYEETDDKIDVLVINIFSKDSDKVDTMLLDNNIINIDDNTKLSYTYLM